MHSASPSVAAVIVTFNRKDVLAETLVAVLDQERSAQTIIVVDNASTDGTRAMLERDHPSVTYVDLGDNLGFGAGIAAGMGDAIALEHDYIWILDDDSRPRPQALRRCLEAADAVPHAGIVGLSGGLLRWGVPLHGTFRDEVDDMEGAPVYRCDFVLIDGALVRSPAAREVGLPRSDLFMMMEDIEYSSRLGARSWDVLVIDDDLIARGHLGSNSRTGSSPPWRGYYHSRNHLLISLEHRSLRELAGWLYQQAKLIVGIALFRDQKWQRISMRMKGALHGLRGITGRTIDP